MPRPAGASAGPWRIALAGMVALAVAMGIGRFAFTPLLPMMLHDGVLDLASASWLASSNYLGYLLGALLCTCAPAMARRWPALTLPAGAKMLRAGLVATGALTLGMAVPWPQAWPLLRFAAGVASAFVFIFTSGWCLSRLAQLHSGALGGVMYAGPGAGIVLSGLLASAMVALGWSAAAGWLLFGVLAAGLTAGVWCIYAEGPLRGVPAGAAVQPTAPAVPAVVPKAEFALLALAYGLAGFGYIITATFLPVIARQAIPGSAWLDLFWPIFGSAVVAGALLCTRVRLAGDLRYWLAGAYLVQAAGVLASVLSPSRSGFALGSVLLGLPFTAITFFAMLEVRRLRPDAVASAMGLLTALYGLGQILGPPLAAGLLRRSPNPAAGFALSLQIAAGALLAGAALYLLSARRWPRR